MFVSCYNTIRQKLFTFVAALAKDFGVGVNDENKFDDYVKRDKSGHDDHVLFWKTEMPYAKEHRCRYNATGAS